MSRPSTSSMSNSSTLSSTSTRQLPSAWKSNYALQSTSEATLTSSPITPPPRAAMAMQKQDDMLLQFFGGGKQSESRDDAVTLAETPHSRSYESRTDIESMPGFTKGVVMEARSRSVARYMFLYGFIFPPLWLFGVALLNIPLRAPLQWAETKSEEEQAMLLADMRAEEVKWSKRCLYALGVLLLVVAIILAIVLVVVRSH